MQDPENEQTAPQEAQHETPDYTADPVEIFPEAEADTDEAPPAEEAEQPKPESRVRRFFRKLLRWTLGILIVIGLGFLAAVFLIYQPKVEALQQAQGEIAHLEATLSAQANTIDTLNADLADLQGQITALNRQIEDLQAKNQSLLDAQRGFQLQIALLQARANVVSAQVALYDDNPIQARKLLESAGELLDAVETMLPDDTQGVITPLQARLELARGELDDAPNTAIKDLTILAGDLLEIESTLFEGE